MATTASDVNESMMRDMGLWESIDDPNVVRETYGWLANTDAEIIEIPDGRQRFLLVRHVLDESLASLNQKKSLLDNVDANLLREAKNATNPYALLDNSIFMNRSAVKLANIDALLGFVISEPRETGRVFADICGGPGGFTEYLLWRHGWRARGFGISLRQPTANRFADIAESGASVEEGDSDDNITVAFSDEDDERRSSRSETETLLADGGRLRHASADNGFMMDMFVSADTETFQAFYGVGAGTGDITDVRNLQAFVVLMNEPTTGGAGMADFVMADGGLDVTGNENQVEEMSQSLYLCQCIIMLGSLCNGGDFLLKTFDIFSESSQTLLYMMFLCFDRMCILKPRMSRPSNSERYIFFQSYRRPTVGLGLFGSLHQFYARYTQVAASSTPTTLASAWNECFPPPFRSSNFLNFLKYLTASCCEFTIHQMAALDRIIAYTNSNGLDADGERIFHHDNRQSLRLKYLREWKLPNIMRTPNRRSTIVKIREELGVSRNYFEIKNAHHKNGNDDNKTTQLFISPVRCTFFYCGNNNEISELQNGRWIRTTSTSGNLGLLPKNTIVFGHTNAVTGSDSVSTTRVIPESCGGPRVVRRHRKTIVPPVTDAFDRRGLAIVDALLLSNESMMGIPIEERRRRCTLFVKNLRHHGHRMAYSESRCRIDDEAKHVYRLGVSNFHVENYYP